MPYFAHWHIPSHLKQTALSVSDHSHVKKEHLPQSHPKKRTRQPPELIAMSVRWNHEAPQLRTIGGKNEGVVFKVLTAGLSVSSSADLVLTLPQYPHGDLPRRVGLLEGPLFFGRRGGCEAQPRGAKACRRKTALEKAETDLKRAREEAMAFGDEKCFLHAFVQNELQETKPEISLKTLETAVVETTEIKRSQERSLNEAKREFDELMLRYSEPMFRSALVQAPPSTFWKTTKRLSGNTFGRQTCGRSGPMLSHLHNHPGQHNPMQVLEERERIVSVKLFDRFASLVYSGVSAVIAWWWWFSKREAKPPTGTYRKFERRNWQALHFSGPGRRPTLIARRKGYLNAVLITYVRRSTERNGCANTRFFKPSSTAKLSRFGRKLDDELADMASQTAVSEATLMKVKEEFEKLQLECSHTSARLSAEKWHLSNILSRNAEESKAITDRRESSSELDVLIDATIADSAGASLALFCLGPVLTTATNSQSALLARSIIQICLERSHLLGRLRRFLLRMIQEDKNNNIDKAPLTLWSLQPSAMRKQEGEATAPDAPLLGAEDADKKGHDEADDINLRRLLDEERVWNTVWAGRSLGTGMAAILVAEWCPRRTSKPTPTNGGLFRMQMKEGRGWASWVAVGGKHDQPPSHLNFFTRRKMSPRPPKDL
ncbi:hypothetical protein DFJ73DRAFT_949556 [Zopfochytrium polystomum]|nr:hypothetical protein DFJ73DRAFT_949556 [Zopfochytrium polystomum]